jgi:hypothetical protein
MIYSSYESKVGASSLKQFTLGNLGQSQSICAITKFGLNRNFLECSTGVITSISSFGLLEAASISKKPKTFFDGLF